MLTALLLISVAVLTCPRATAPSSLCLLNYEWLYIYVGLMSTNDHICIARSDKYISQAYLYTYADCRAHRSATWNLEVSHSHTRNCVQIPYSMAGPECKTQTRKLIASQRIRGERCNIWNCERKTIADWLDGSGWRFPTEIPTRFRHHHQSLHAYSTTDDARER